MWMVEAVYTAEPDTKEDVEYLRAKAQASGEVTMETPRAVIERTMLALRRMDEPYPLHGAVTATRYCSPRNRASELSPEVFAGYLQDPWYAILGEWDEMQWAEDEEEEVEAGVSQTEVEVLVRREGEDSFSMVSWNLALYDDQWLIDSLNIIS